MNFRAQASSVLASLFLIGVAFANVTPALAAPSPDLMLKPQRVSVGESLTIQLRHCDTPQLFAGSPDGALSAVGAAGSVQITDRSLAVVAYLPAAEWSALRSDWTSSFTADLPTGSYFIRVGCGDSYIVGSALTVRS